MICSIDWFETCLKMNLEYHVSIQICFVSNCSWRFKMGGLLCDVTLKLYIDKRKNPLLWPASSILYKSQRKMDLQFCPINFSLISFPGYWQTRKACSCVIKLSTYKCVLLFIWLKANGKIYRLGLTMMLNPSLCLSNTKTGTHDLCKKPKLKLLVFS